jgi:hypothetical protein
MTEPSSFENSVVEWKHRHRIRDDDPILAALELLKLFFQEVKIELPADSDSAKLVEVRAAIQQLNRLGTDFSKQARDLTLEMRTLPELDKQLRCGRTTAFVIMAVACLGTGILIGKFLL